MYKIILALLSVVLFPAATSAHEVYVLDQETIERGLTGPSPNPFTQIAQDPQLFILWGIIAVIFVSTIFAMSITHWFETRLNPVLSKLKPYAAPIARITLGICLIASASEFALFGPELPLSDFGDFAFAMQMALYISGILCLVGLCTRTGALIALGTFLFGVFRYEGYMLTYANYLGEILLALILGGGLYSADKALGWKISALPDVRHVAERLAFPILRVLFGLSVAYAAYYAKFLHSQLALDVVTQYNLTNFFHFDPLFIVLGASIVEVLIGVFIMFGFEIRHTALFFLFWIFLSLLYFGESVWPHLILVGVLLSLFCHGYDRYSFGGLIHKLKGREPIL
jgi:uncharacterized membrane protein YphA (DoxX/SURF4 family)